MYDISVLNHLEEAVHPEIAMGCGECANEETGFIAFTLVVDAEVVHLVLCKEVTESI